MWDRKQKAEVQWGLLKQCGDLRIRRPLGVMIRKYHFPESKQEEDMWGAETSQVLLEY